MYTIEMMRIQYLNGQNIIKNYWNKTSKKFHTKEQLEDFRKLRELKLQFRCDSRYRQTHPGCSDEEVKRCSVKVSVLFNLKEDQS